MDTFVQVPVFSDVPKFLMKRAILSFIRKFIDWSLVEYTTAVQYYRSIGQERFAIRIEKHFNDRIIASMRPEFENICSLMTADVWNSLSRRERSFLNEVYAIRFSQK